MIPVTSFAGRKVALFGFAGSGTASASALLAGGADVVAFDDSPERVEAANHAGIPTADLREIDWGKIAALILSPGVPLTHPAPHWAASLAQAAGVEVIGDIELFCRERRLHAPDAPFIAITGTNGKSTTTALIAHLLKTAGKDVQLGGNIGTAILSLEPPRAGRTYVIECSSYQIDLAPSLAPSIGVLINLSEDHLDRHGSMRNYAAVKERLVAAVQPGGTAVIGVDDDWCTAAADRVERAGKRVVRISVRHPLTDGLYIDGEQIVQAAGGTAHAIALLGGIRSLRGVHNAQNAACASAAALASGLDERAIQRGLWSFPGLAHRMEEIGHKGNVLFVNDSKATNADFGGTGPGLLQGRVLDCRRQSEDRGYRIARAIFPAHPQGLPDRRSGARFRGDTRRRSCERGRREARSCRHAGGKGCGSLRPDGCGRTALAGLCVV